MSTLFGKTKKATKRKRSDEDPAMVGRSCPSIPANNAQKPTLANDQHTAAPNTSSSLVLRSFDDLGLVEPLVSTCRKLGFRHPTPVQRQLIPFLLHNRREHVLALAATGSGKTAAFVLPIVHHLQSDPYGVYAVIVTPTRELAKQIHQQCLALGSAFNVTSVMVVGGLDSVQQSCALQHQPPHFLVATPGRLAALLRGPPPRPRLQHCRYVVFDEADRLLASSNNNNSNCGFERDVAELLLHIHSNNNNNTTRKESCQTLLFSATMTASLTAMEEIAGGGKRLPLRKFIVHEDGEEDEQQQQQNELVATGIKKVATETTRQDAVDCDKKIDNGDETEPVHNNSPDKDSDSASNCDVDDDDDKNCVITVGPKIPNSLQQEYVFMPSKVRDAYLLATVRALMAYGGRSPQDNLNLQQHQNRRGNRSSRAKPTTSTAADEAGKAKSAIIFVSTCERAAFVSGLLEQVGVANVALHSLLSQPRRLAALGKFQSEQVRVLVATDVAARGLDIPHTDLVINAELPRNPINYVHRVGRTARAGRRGLAVSLVAETDIQLVHAAEKASGRELVKCEQVTDDIAVTLLGPTTKAARLVKLKLADIGFDELVQKFKERKVRDRKERQRLDRALRKQEQRK